jgi:RNA polymerase sigma factor (sigma-70 family)
MLSHEEKVDSFTEFVSIAEGRLRGAFTAAFGMDAGREICAETLAYAWEHWDRVAPMDNPAGYLYRVGNRRGRRIRPTYETTHEPRSVGSHAWFEPGLAGALASLSERQRVVVSLVHGYDWTLAEVAELLGVGKSTVRSYELRALKRLRGKLGVGV